MTWKYTVEECQAENHDGECGPWRVADIKWGDGWRDAYRKAEELPHAIVSSAYLGNLPYKKTPHTVFEHIESGGLCFYCGKGRGPLCKTVDKNVFICDACQAIYRRMHEQTSRDYGWDPDRRLYVPIIETIDF
ncbi:hypothetical protein [Streptomyces prunicolor]|uniref:hypothetical protein n=1 Tax=Streptomyces prunicolor TaxID=67348 RepID=UPI0033E3E5A8